MPTLPLDDATSELLAYVLTRALDDLEARAIIAEHHDLVLGPPSAAAYRRDATRLGLLLDRLTPTGLPFPTARPDLVAVRWIDDHVYVIVDRRPVRVAPTTTDSDRRDARASDDHDVQTEMTADGAASRLLPNVQAVTVSSAAPVHDRQPAHRLAPRCSLASRRGFHGRWGS